MKVTAAANFILSGRLKLNIGYLYFFVNVCVLCLEF